MSEPDRYARLKELHDRASTAHHRKNIRLRARALAARLNTSVPEWAAMRREMTAAPAPASPQPAPMPAAPAAIPISLSAWRAGTCRVVNLRGDGVRLIDFRDDGAYEATFADASEAERALSAGVTWRPVRIPERPGNTMKPHSAEIPP